MIGDHHSARPIGVPAGPREEYRPGPAPYRRGESLDVSTIAEDVVTAVKKGAQTISDIERVTGLARQQVHAAVSSLVKRGILKDAGAVQGVRTLKLPSQTAETAEAGVKGLTPPAVQLDPPGALSQEAALAEKTIEKPEHFIPTLQEVSKMCQQEKPSGVMAHDRDHCDYGAQRIRYLAGIAENAMQMLSGAITELSEIALKQANDGADVREKLEKIVAALPVK